MLQEPEQCVTYPTQLGKFAEYQMDCLLHATIGILFQPLVIGLQVSNRLVKERSPWVGRPSFAPRRWLRSWTLPWPMVSHPSTTAWSSWKKIGVSHDIERLLADSKCSVW
jgi:hypothetical protein